MLDERNQRYIDKGQVVELTYKETNTLKLLIENRNKVIKYSEISRTVIHRLKQKLKGILEIKNKRAVGFYIN